MARQSQPQRTLARGNEVYQRQYGLNIVAAEEELRVDLVGRSEARQPGLQAGAPLLHIERVAVSLDGTRVERAHGAALLEHHWLSRGGRAVHIYE